MKYMDKHNSFNMIHCLLIGGKNNMERMLLTILRSYKPEHNGSGWAVVKTETVNQTQHQYFIENV